MGTNPLPNYVAAKLLAKPDGYIYFVYTDETDKITNRLIEVLKLKDDKYFKIPTDGTDEANIFNQVARYAKGKKDIGINYTGGTKIMSVQSYRAIEKISPDAVFSYLDARELSMRISKLNELIAPYPVEHSVKLPFSDLLFMHGYTLDHPPEKNPIQYEVACDLANLERDSLDSLRCWCNYNLRSGPRTPIKGTTGNRKKKEQERKQLMEIKLPEDDALIVLSSSKHGCNTLGELSKKWGIDIGELARWLDGKWLEHYTLWAVKKAASSCDINDWGLNIEPKEKDFEFDVAAMFGYQLFAISCTTDKNKGLLKQKLFEAYIRARQMGGEEARVGLVCCASPEDPNSNPEKIEHEIQEEWDAKYKIRVFGADTLPKLPEIFEDWFKLKASNEGQDQ